MIGQGMHGFVENKELVIADIDKALREPTDKRIFVISKAFRAGYTIDQVHDLTKIDKWFLQKLMNIMRTSEELRQLTVDSGQLAVKDAAAFFNSQLSNLSPQLLRKAKVQGFSDFQIARGIGFQGDMEDGILYVRNYRKSVGILPVVKQIDTLAAEYPAQTNYLYPVSYTHLKHSLSTKRGRFVLLRLINPVRREPALLSVFISLVVAMQTFIKSVSCWERN